MRDVFIRGISCSQVSRFSQNLAEITSRTARQALQQAGTTRDDIEFVIFANTSGGLLQNQESIRGQSWLQELRLGGIPLINIENACNSGGSAFFTGCELARRIDGAVLVVGSEGMNIGNRDRTLDAIESCIPEKERQQLITATRDAAPSIFMHKNRQWTEDFIGLGGSLEQLASVVVKSRDFASHNDIAQFRERVSMDQVLTSAQVSGPLTRLMCSSFSDGAAACVLSSLQAPEGIQVIASHLTTGDGSLCWHDRIRAAGDGAFRIAGVSTSEIDIIETHDATAAEELLALETLGFYPKGAAGEATCAGCTGIGSDFLVNPSGGLISRGHPMGATGIYQIFEIVQQLKGLSGARQAPSARMGMSINVGGYISGDAASVSSHILCRP